MLEPAKEMLSAILKPGGSALCAVSGGMDSMCLLHLMTTWGTSMGFRVAAAHFHHGLRGENADRDERFVRDYCADRGIPFLCGRGDTRVFAAAGGLSLEEAARKLRYQYLNEAARQAEADWILTAHHADDNAETMLLNLCRGTGLRGLTGIPPVRGNLCRPFRDIPREQLEQYAEVNGIPHVEDETNAEDEAARNLLRHRVLPVLKEINPRAVEHFAETARTLAAEDGALDRLASTLIRKAEVLPRRVKLPKGALPAAPDAVRRRAVLEVLRSIPEIRGSITAAHVTAVGELLLRPAGQVSLPEGWIARITGDSAVLEPAPGVPESALLREGKTVRFGDWDVTLGGEPEEGISYRVIPCSPARVTAWNPEDRMTLPGSRGARSVKRLCADHGIFPRRRDGLPVLRFDERPAAIPGIGVDTAFLPELAEMAQLITFQYRGEKL